MRLPGYSTAEKDTFFLLVLEWSYRSTGPQDLHFYFIFGTISVMVPQRGSFIGDAD